MVPTRAPSLQQYFSLGNRELTITRNSHFNAPAMPLHFTTAEKILLFKIALKPLDDYDPHLKKILEVIKKFYLTTLMNQGKGNDIYACIAEIEALIMNLESKIKKQRNFSQIMKQIHIENYL